MKCNLCTLDEENNKSISLQRLWLSKRHPKKDKMLKFQKYLNGMAQMVSLFMCVISSRLHALEQLQNSHIQSVPGGMCQTSGGCSLC